MNRRGGRATGTAGRARQPDRLVPSDLMRAPGHTGRGRPVGAEIGALLTAPMWRRPPMDRSCSGHGRQSGPRILSGDLPQAWPPAALRVRLRVNSSPGEDAGDRTADLSEASIRPGRAASATWRAAVAGASGRRPRGASTYAELAVAALPSVLIPLKIATDDHQTLSARPDRRRGRR
jgi:UDP-N-acetylglucosamine--N-acetylmuramyl-(pentapeptide) pyrophosphoryl-undecaprenol N-acetylglucosamine transferase